MTITLRRLAGTPEDHALVQHVLECAPRYHHLTQGAPAGPPAAAAIFLEAPPHFDAEDKQVLAILADGVPVGIADVVSGHPRADVAFIGLLVIEEPAQGRGVGRAAASAIDDLARSWQACRMRLGVVQTNAPALAFWPRVGYHATGELRAWSEGAVTSQVVVFEKPLGPVDLRACTAADLEQVRAWRALPHVARAWGAAPDLPELAAEHASRTPDEPAFLITEHGAPIGFAQACRAAAAGGGWWPSEPPDTWGIDLFLGDLARLGRGLGHAAVAELARRLFVQHGAAKVIADPAPGNAASLRCFARAGFVPTGRVETPDGPAELMVLTRRAFDGVHTVRALWTELLLGRWKRARRLLAPDFTAHWPHTGERFDGADAFIAVNSAYPGQHYIRVLDVSAVADEVVSTVHVVSRDPDQECWAVSRWRLTDGLLARVVEYWCDRQPVPQFRA